VPRRAILQRPRYIYADSLLRSTSNLLQSGGGPYIINNLTIARVPTTRKQKEMFTVALRLVASEPREQVPSGQYNGNQFRPALAKAYCPDLPNGRWGFSGDVFRGLGCALFP
jgi:hypothetical protein